MKQLSRVLAHARPVITLPSTMIGPEVLYRLEQGEVDEVDEGPARAGHDGEGQQR